MKKTVLTFGVISGALSALMMIATVPFMHQIGFDRGFVVGYTAILLSFLLVFFGIRSYRENEGAGSITFGRAFAVGILITLISCVFYVVTWEILYFNFLPGFMDEWTAHSIERLKASGATSEVILKQTESMKGLQQLLDNPLYNAGMTFIEPFPIGLIVTLVSAAALRRRGKPIHD